MIYTLDYLEKEAEMIASYWNGKDDSYIDGNGDKRTEEDVENAQELLLKLRQVRDLIKELAI